MANMYITEYAELATDPNGRPIPVGKEPAIAVQNVAFTTSTASAAFNGRTKFVRIYLSAAGHVAFGASPTADTDSTPMAATTAEYFGVVGGQKVAAVTAS